MISFLLLFGGIFFGVGLLLTIAFAAFLPVFGLFVLFPMVFLLTGLGVLIYAGVLIRRKADVVKKGTRYPAKIYGYVEDKSYMLNGDYTVNLKVHFFDNSRIEREAVIVTNFPKNSNMYGIGMTIDIFEYRGQYGYDKESLRYEHIRGEEELMDNKPVSPEQQTHIAVRCPSCGASFNAVKGYANKCPYCGGYTNA